MDELGRVGDRRRDWIAFTIAFKGVFLEGTEVAFIVFAVGANGRSLPVAALGGVAAMAVVAAVGAIVRHPLAAVPENTLKYGVGVMLASLGTFWAAEGMGAVWPYDVGSILALIALYLAASWGAVALVRGRAGRPEAAGERVG